MAKQRSAQALLVQEKSGYKRVEAPCPYFGVCGGCALQDLSYEDQLALKRERIQQAFAPLGQVPPVDLCGLEDPWRYRNKAELTFGGGNGELTLGYHAARSFWRVVDLEDCLLLPEPVTRVARDVRTFAAKTRLPAYDPKTHQGFFRYLLIRSSQATGQILACLITASGPADGAPRAAYSAEAAASAAKAGSPWSPAPRPGGGDIPISRSGGPPIPPGVRDGTASSGIGVRELMEGFADELMAAHPSVSSVYWGITNRVADVALPEELILLRGTAYLEDQLGPFRLKLHPLSFLQPNSVQADRIYVHLARAIGDVPDGVAWDLYCGVGLVSFYLSAHVRKIYGIDSEPHHLELAAQNAALNGLRNIEFRVGRVETLLMDRRFWLQEAKPDLVVVDPPRAGLHPQALSSLLAARPLRIAYLSCNVRSLVRDLQGLLSSFPRYRLAGVQAFDMFPQTNHVEILTLLERQT